MSVHPDLLWLLFGFLPPTYSFLHLFYIFRCLPSSSDGMVVFFFLRTLWRFQKAVLESSSSVSWSHFCSMWSWSLFLTAFCRFCLLALFFSLMVLLRTSSMSYRGFVLVFFTSSTFTEAISPQHVFRAKVFFFCSSSFLSSLEPCGVVFAPISCHAVDSLGWMSAAIISSSTSFGVIEGTIPLIIQMSKSYRPYYTYLHKRRHASLVTYLDNDPTLGSMMTLNASSLAGFLAHPLWTFHIHGSRRQTNWD